MNILFLESHPMWIYGLPNGFRDLGHNVKISGPINRRKLTGIIKDFKPQLIFTMSWGEENTAKWKQECIKECVLKAKVPHVYWATEDPTHTDTFTLPYVRYVSPDFIFTICAKRVKEYRSLGFKSDHCDFGYHRSVHRKVKPNPSYNHTLAIIANGYPVKLKKYSKHYRHSSIKTLISPLLKAGRRIDFYGTNWDKMKPFLGTRIPKEWIHGYLDYRNANKVYSTSKIILGLQNHPSQLTQRTYEVLGSGGFLITSDTPEIRKHFKPGVHLVTSKSPADTIRLVEHYLNNPRQREQIALAGQKAAAKHSYKHRAAYMLQVLKKNKII